MGHWPPDEVTDPLALDVASVLAACALRLAPIMAMLSGLVADMWPEDHSRRGRSWVSSGDLDDYVTSLSQINRATPPASACVLLLDAIATAERANHQLDASPGRLASLRSPHEMRRSMRRVFGRVVGRYPSVAERELARFLDHLRTLVLCLSESPTSPAPVGRGPRAWARERTLPNVRGDRARQPLQPAGSGQVFHFDDA